MYMFSELLSSVTRLSNHELLGEAERLARREREATAALVAHLAEIEARGLHVREGFESLFCYCRTALGLGEHETYNRIQVARAARRFPLILDLLAEASVNLTAVRLLAPYLTDGNHRAVLESARGKTRREVEEIVARLCPRPDVTTSIRKLPSAQDAPAALLEAVVKPQPAGDAPAASPLPAPPQPFQPPRPHTVAVTPLAPERYKLQITVGGTTVEKLRLAQEMLRHAIPSGDEAEIVDRALTLLLDDLARKKFAKTESPRPSPGTAPGSRHIPAEVKRAVWLRDLGRCTFVGDSGRRCTSRAFLEFHHEVPYAAGGEATVENIRLACRAHNALESDLFFGPRKPSNEVVKESEEFYVCTPEHRARFETSSAAAGQPP
jgi:hypothetical protein